MIRLPSFPRGGTGFLRPVPAQLAGDFNLNGAIDAADYVLWRNTLGSTSNLAADGNGNRVVDSGDYTLWRRRFGAVAGVGAELNLAPELPHLVPEPASWMLLLLAFFGLTSRLRPIESHPLKSR